MLTPRFFGLKKLQDPMARCIIHIGMHKTGSSSIQNSLFRFADSRFFYANLGEVANHSLAIFSLFADHPGRHHLHQINNRNARAVQEYIEKIRKEMEISIAAANNRSLLISGEDIGALTPSELVKLREFFQQNFNDLVIVGYVRPPGAYMSSAFQERIKGAPDVRFNIPKTYRSYRRSFEKFDEVFKSSNVLLWKFDPASFPAGCVVRDFCTRLGIDLPVERIVRVNESLSQQAAVLLYTYRKLGRWIGSRTMKGPESVRLGTAIDEPDAPKFRLSPSVVNPVLDKNRADIEWMESRIGQSLQEETGEHQPGDVLVETDLLRPEPKMVQKLFSLLGDSAPKGVKGDTSREVALLVHALRKKSSSVNNLSELTSYPLRLKTGKIMRAEPRRVAGWAIGADPNQPVRVVLYVNGREVARALANKPRPWLKHQGMHPTGRCGFEFQFDPERALMEGDRLRINAIGSTFESLIQARVVAVRDTNRGTDGRFRGS
jgi:hypothetical protein